MLASCWIVLRLELIDERLKAIELGFYRPNVTTLGNVTDALVGVPAFCGTGSLVALIS